MKKLRLNPIEISEVLTREQMKKVMGGNGSEGSGTGNIYCSLNGNLVRCMALPLLTCAENCAEVAYNTGGFCGGCAEMP